MAIATLFVHLARVYRNPFSFISQAPWIPGDVHLPRMWQDRRLPPQQRVPDLQVVIPPEYLRHDRRLPWKRKNDDQRGPRDATSTDNAVDEEA